MNTCEDTAFKFIQENPSIYDTLKTTIGAGLKLDMIAKIAKNTHLFNKLCMAECGKYQDLLSALVEFDGTNILIHFTDIDLYGVFTRKGYLNFTSALRNMTDNGDNINIQQLVLTDQKQKFVFACTNKNYLDKIQKYVNEYFGHGKVSNSNSEITVDIKLGGSQESAEVYNKLFNHIYGRDKVTCEFLRQIPVTPCFRVNYRSYNVNNSINATQLSELLDYLKDTPPDKSTLNTFPDVATANNKLSVTDWIKQNPPHNIADNKILPAVSK